MGGVSRGFRAVAAMLLAAAGLAGCGRSLTVLQYPPFYTEQIKTIAVLPFRDLSGPPGEGEVFTETLLAALRGNGTYKVLDRGGLEALLKAAGDAGAMDRPVEELAAAAGKSGGVQAILTGTVLRRGALAWVQVEAGYPGPYWRYRRRSWWGGGYYARYEAMVAVTARVVGAPDGKTIYATDRPIRAWAYADDDWGPRGWPDASPWPALETATDEVVRELVSRVAVVPGKVKVNPDRSLRTAAKADGGRWRFTDDFRIADEEMFAVVSLPPAADRNRFRLTVVRKGSPEVLAEGEFTWSRERREEALAFSPKDLAAKGGGAGTYLVRFHAADAVVMTRRFHIAP